MGDQWLIFASVEVFPVYMICNRQVEINWLMSQHSHVAVFPLSFLYHLTMIKIWDEFHYALIILLYKNKGIKSGCGNYRGISLFSIAGKILARVIVNRLITVFEDILPEIQYGFRPGWSIVDMIFTLRQLQEKCIEQNMALYSAFLNLMKAFDKGRLFG